MVPVQRCAFTILFNLELTSFNHERSEHPGGDSIFRTGHQSRIGKRHRPPIPYRHSRTTSKHKRIALASIRTEKESPGTLIRNNTLLVTTEELPTPSYHSFHQKYDSLVQIIRISTDLWPTKEPLRNVDKRILVCYLSWEE
jgi:hypothetical protein